MPVRCSTGPSSGLRSFSEARARKRLQRLQIVLQSALPHAAVAVASDAELAFLLKTAGGEAPLERATALFARCDLDRDLLLSGKELEAALAAAQDDVRANEAATVRGKAADPAARERYLAQRLATDALVRGLAVVASVGTQSSRICQNDAVMR